MKRETATTQARGKGKIRGSVAIVGQEAGSGDILRQETDKFNYVTDISLPRRSCTEVNEIKDRGGPLLVEVCG